LRFALWPHNNRKTEQCNAGIYANKRSKPSIIVRYNNSLLRNNNDEISIFLTTLIEWTICPSRSTEKIMTIKCSMWIMNNNKSYANINMYSYINIYIIYIHSNFNKDTKCKTVITTNL
jgi:hypothetical protein